MHRSSGLSVVPFLDGAVVFDAVTRRFHRVGSTAALILLTREPVSVERLIEEVAAASGRDPADVTADVTAGIDQLRAAGLLDRQGAVWVEDPIRGATERAGAQRHLTVPLRVFDTHVRFACSSGALSEQIDRRLGVDCRDVSDGTDTGPCTDTGLCTDTIQCAGTVIFDAESRSDGSILLEAAETWEFSTAADFLRQLPGVVNDFAARSSSVAVLHAGGVVTPSGRVIVVSGDSGAGKSTLVAALVRRGCDYLGDEYIGIDFDHPRAWPYQKPLELDEHSCTLFGLTALDHNVEPAELRDEVLIPTGPTGQVDAVVFTRFQEGADLEIVRARPDIAVRLLLQQTTNLDYALEHALRGVCRLAEEVPVISITHGDSLHLAAALAEPSPITKELWGDEKT